MKKSVCLKNLKNCKAICCRFFTFQLEKVVPGLKRYLELHRGIKVNGNVVFVFSPCKALDEKTMKCKLYKSGRMPEHCRRAYSEVKDGLVKPPGCAYYDEGENNEN